MSTRDPAVAGLFYPAEATKLHSMVENFLAEAPPASDSSPKPRALIVPHAGYVYSGSTAALAYSLWRDSDIEHVVIVGPTHRVGIRAVALPEAKAMATPLGDVPVWTEGVAAIADLPQVEVSAVVHAQEHSLEVQLPFLQCLLPQADVLPLAAGWVAPELVAEIIETVWATPKLGLVISSDLSHYLGYDEAKLVDQATLERILALDATIDHEQACGATGINSLLLIAARHQLVPKLIQACNSGDTAGDKRRVVGYAALAFYQDGETS